MSRSIQRSFNAMAKVALRTGSRAIKMALKSAKRTRKPSTVKPTSAQPATTASHWTAGIATSVHGTLRYRLFAPPRWKTNELLPLVVMLHGCAQDAEALASSSKMNQLAQRERFMVLYPEQDRLSNLQNCWNWYDTRTGRAQREADSIAATAGHICQTHRGDPLRVALIGLSAGASLASLLATRQPNRFSAVVMHSGLAPGLATSTATALAAMRGRRAAVPLKPLAAGMHLPALLVIQGTADPIVSPSNGALAAQLWANCEGAQASQSRELQRGKRYPTTVTDYRCANRLVATLCLINGLGHAWSGGAPGLAYSDPKGPDASRMAWSFIQKQFSACQLLSESQRKTRLQSQ